MSVADELMKLQDLRTAGALSEEEHERAKQRVLGTLAVELASDKEGVEFEAPAGRQPSIFSADAAERHAAWTPSAVKRLKWLCWSAGLSLLFIAGIAVANAGSGEGGAAYETGYSNGSRAARDGNVNPYEGNDYRPELARETCTFLFGLSASLGEAGRGDSDDYISGCMKGVADQSPGSPSH